MELPDARRIRGPPLTIPINPVHTGTTGVVERPQISPGIALILHALQQRQELGLARQKLAQDQQEFELRSKIAGTQLEGMKLENEKRKRDFKQQDEDLAAQDEALRIYTGSLPQLGDPQGIGTVIAGIKDPKVAAHFYTLLQEGQKVMGAVTPSYEIRPGATEYVGINPKKPTDTVPTGVKVPIDAASRRIPVVTEREKASAAVGAIRANALINRLDTTDPTIGARVAQKAANRKSIISGLMRRLTGTSQEDANLLAESQIEQSMTPDELEYYVAGKQLLSSILPGLSGKQVTAREYVMHAPAYLSLGSTNPRVIQSRAQARSTRIRGFIAEAGEAMAERIPELQGIDLTPYGLGSVTLPDNTVHEITPGRARFHPKFNVRAP